MAVSHLTYCGTAFLDARERQLVARLAQLRQVGLGETLVLANEIRRKRDVLDQAPVDQLRERQRLVTGQRPAGIDVGCRQLVEGLRPTAADVEDTRFFEMRMIKKMQVDARDIPDMNEIAPLLAVGIAGAAFEELDLALALRNCW
jgi:hypothetical protein